jgi:hypothetical protein
MRFQFQFYYYFLEETRGKEQLRIEPGPVKIINDFHPSELSCTMYFSDLKTRVLYTVYICDA